MTEQEIFDKVVIHLLTQNKKSIIEGTANNCAYRGANGLKCAIGCLIPDEKYKPKMEGRLVEILIYNYPDIGLESNNIMFLKNLQNVHDLFPPSEWRFNLQKLANHYKLTMPEVNK